MRHNYWLDWKLRHGLAIRGRGQIPFCPKGLVAQFLYRVHFKKVDVQPDDQSEALEQPPGKRVFKQAVGGALGAAGKCNGE